MYGKKNPTSLFFYQIFLLNAYKYGQLSQVYPVARGLSPLIIVVVSSIFIGEVLSKFELIGVICVSVALLAYGIKINFQSKKNMGGFVFAIITVGLPVFFIASLYAE